MYPEFTKPSPSSTLKKLTLFFLTTYNSLSIAINRTLYMEKTGTRIIPSSELLVTTDLSYFHTTVIEQEKKLFLDLREKGRISLENSYESKIVETVYNQDEIFDEGLPFFTFKFDFWKNNKQMLFVAYKRFFKFFEIKEYDLDLILKVKIHEITDKKNANFSEILVGPEDDKIIIYLRLESDDDELDKNSEFDKLSLGIVKYSDGNFIFELSSYITRLKKVKIFSKKTDEFVKYCETQNTKKKVIFNPFLHGDIFSLSPSTLLVFCNLDKESENLGIDSDSLYTEISFYNLSEKRNLLIQISTFCKYSFSSFDQIGEEMKYPEPIRVDIFGNYIIIFDKKGIYYSPVFWIVKSSIGRFSIFQKIIFSYNHVDCNSIYDKEMGCYLYYRGQKSRVHGYEFFYVEGDIYFLESSFLDISTNKNIQKIIKFKKTFTVIEKRGEELKIYMLKNGGSILFGIATHKIQSSNQILAIREMNGKNLDSEIFEGNFLILEKNPTSENTQISVTIFSVAMPYFEFTPLNHELKDHTCQEYIQFCLSTDITIFLVNQKGEKFKYSLSKIKRIFLIDEIKFNGLLSKKDNVEEITKKNLTLDSNGDLKINLENEFYGFIKESQVVRNIRVGKKKGKDIKILAEGPEIYINDFTLDIKIKEDIFEKPYQAGEIKEFNNFMFISVTKNSVTIFAEVFTNKTNISFLMLKNPTYISSESSVYNLNKENTLLISPKKFQNLRFKNCFYSHNKENDASILVGVCFLQDKDTRILHMFVIEFYLRDMSRYLIYELGKISEILNQYDKIIDAHFYYVGKNTLLFISTEKEIKVILDGRRFLRLTLNQITNIEIRELGVFEEREIYKFKIYDVFRWKSNTLVIVFKSELESVVLVANVISDYFSLSIIGSYIFKDNIEVFLSRKTLKMAVYVERTRRMFEFDLERDILHRENPKENFILEPVKISFYDKMIIRTYKLYKENDKNIYLADEDENFRIIYYSISSVYLYQLLILKFEEKSQVTIKRIYNFKQQSSIKDVNFYGYGGNKEGIFDEFYHIFIEESKFLPPSDQFYTHTLRFISCKNRIVVKNPTNLFEKADLRNSNKSEVLRLRFQDTGGITYEESFYFQYNQFLKFGKIEEKRILLEKNEIFKYDYSNLGGIVTKSALKCPDGYETKYTPDKFSIKKVACEKNSEKLFFSNSKIMKKIEDLCNDEKCLNIYLKDIKFKEDFIFTLQDDKLIVYNFKNQHFQKIFTLKVDLTYRNYLNSNKRENLREINDNIFEECETITNIKKTHIYYETLVICKFRLGRSRIISTINNSSRYNLLIQVNRTQLEDYRDNNYHVENRSMAIFLDLTVDYIGLDNVVKFEFFEDLYLRMRNVSLVGNGVKTQLDIKFISNTDSNVVYSSFNRKINEMKLFDFLLVNYETEILENKSLIKFVLFEKFNTDNTKSCKFLYFDYISIKFDRMKLNLNKECNLDRGYLIDPSFEDIISILFLEEKSEKYFEDNHSFKNVTIFTITSVSLIENNLNLNLSTIDECPPSYEYKLSNIYAKNIYSISNLCHSNSKYYIRETESLIAFGCMKSDHFESDAKLIFFEKGKNSPGIKNPTAFTIKELENRIIKPIYVEHLPLHNDLELFTFKILEKNESDFILIIQSPLTVMSSYRLNFKMSVRYLGFKGEEKKRKVSDFFVKKRIVNLVAWNEQFESDIELKFLDRLNVDFIFVFLKKQYYFSVIILIYLFMIMILTNLKGVRNFSY